LKKAVPTLLDAMERYGHLRLEAKVCQRLIDMSAATMDRLLKPIREAGKQERRRSAMNTPLRRSIAVRTFSEWREAEKLNAVFNYYILPHQMPMLEEMAGRFPGVKIVVDHLGKPDLKLEDPWPEFQKMFRLKKFPQVWISASEPYELSSTKEYPYRDTIPFFKATYEEFGGTQLIWGTGYPRPRWELPMDKELEFVDKVLDFYTPEDRELLLRRNALRI
jgi:predicted TIM-barrel fold metal-dependent hydrolase